jgi:hypothetical protein
MFLNGASPGANPVSIRRLPGTIDANDRQASTGVGQAGAS